MPKVFFKLCALFVLLSSPVSAQVTDIMTVFDSSTGALSVEGTAGADSIVITLTANGTVEVSGVDSMADAGNVTEISVDGLAGDDQIDLSRVLEKPDSTGFTGISTEDVAITIEGGPGSDTIFGSGFGDTIRGGPGNDFIYGDLLENQEGLELGYQELASTLLGGSNNDRTKDAEIADIDNDGDLDIFDANSNVGLEVRDPLISSDAIVIRFNDGAGAFTVETIFPPDDATSYDADLADLNGDGFPDLIRTLRDFDIPGDGVAPDPGAIAVYLNRQGAFGLNGDRVWFDLGNPDFEDVPGGTPDDVAVGDLDNDGDLDFAIARRDIGDGGGGVQVYLNDMRTDSQDGQRVLFLKPNLLGGNDGSTHDVFFVDADNNGYLDIVAVNEDEGANSRLFLNDGAGTIFNPADPDNPQDFPQGRGGDGADFNGDGRDDLVFGGPTLQEFGGVRLVLNDASNSGRFPNPAGEELVAMGASSIYDLEVGDLNNDGHLDVVGASIVDIDLNGTARIWLNDGNGFLNLFEGSNPLPGLPGNEWLSADLIDYDLDGDLDLYIAGGDGEGRVENQFFVNLLIQHGNDRIEGGPGNDVILGGAGNDTIYGGESIVGDIDLNGTVGFSDIQLFVDLLTSGVFQFEADVDGNGLIDFFDVVPFINLLQNPSPTLADGNDILVGGAGADLIAGGVGDDTIFGFRPTVGDVNRDGEVNFSDIQAFIDVLASGAYQFEADFDEDLAVNLDDIPLFIDLLSNEQSSLRDGAEDTLNGGLGNDAIFDDVSQE